MNKRAKPTTLNPRWDAAEGQLWFGTELLHDFKKSAPAVSPFVDAFQAAKWTTDSLPIPLERAPWETDDEFRRRTETTVKNLNRMVRDTPLHFRPTRDRKAVRYEFLPNRDRKPGQRRT